MCLQIEKKEMQCHNNIFNITHSMCARNHVIVFSNVINTTCIVCAYRDVIVFCKYTMYYDSTVCMGWYHITVCLLYNARCHACISTSLQRWCHNVNTISDLDFDICISNVVNVDWWMMFGEVIGMVTSASFPEDTKVF